MNDSRPADLVAADPFDGALITHGDVRLMWLDNKAVMRPGSAPPSGIEVAEAKMVDHQSHSYASLSITLHDESGRGDERTLEVAQEAVVSRRASASDGMKPERSVYYTTDEFTFSKLARPAMLWSEPSKGMEVVGTTDHVVALHSSPNSLSRSVANFGGCLSPSRLDRSSMSNNSWKN